MSETAERMKAFVTYWESLSGDEKGEAQVYCDRLFRAFGHAGYKESGAILEHRVKGKGGIGSTSFADLVWKPRVLIEMKKRGEKLQLHFRQAFDYWIHLVPDRPRYVVLCNFDEFWIYDFDKQIDEPVDRVAIRELPKRYLALSFLFSEKREPLFGNDREAVTREAAAEVAEVFVSLVHRGVDRAQAQRFVLQLVVAMFAEDVDLMPRGLISQLTKDCFEGQNSFDLFGALFRQMNSPTPVAAGRYQGVPYFNGGLFSSVAPVELNGKELQAVADAASKDWSRVNPAIFGTLFQASMDAGRRHALGAHFTAERDIMKVVGPTISRPWEARINAAKTRKELMELRKDLLVFQVLDPACGSGNFLYVAYREMVRLEILLLARLRQLVSAAEFTKQVKTLSLISPRQFHGLDIDPFAVELAKVTLLFGKKLALDEAMESLDREQMDLDLQGDHVLPLENLDENCVATDALFAEWPQVQAIIGNPPYQSKNKMQAEYGRAYVNRVRARYPDVPGRADYCVFWFRRAHDELPLGGRAGLVGTNTIRQNYSREGGLDHVVENGGTITDAVSTQVWSGEAAVHVSIVNWVKGPAPGPKRLARQVGNADDSPWESVEVERIGPSLSFGLDVSEAVALAVNVSSGGCYQGQTHGHEGFLVPRAEAEAMLAAHPAWAEVLKPYLTADEMLGERDSLPTRYVIDFGSRDLLTSKHFSDLFRRVDAQVLPTRTDSAEREKKRSSEALAVSSSAKTNKHHANFLASWWQLSYPRREMLAKLVRLPRYIVCGQVTKRPIFEFIDTTINPNAALVVFPFADDYSFGILQSGMHWKWFVARCSTLKGDFRYTSNTVFDSFPWPQSPTTAQVKAVAAAAVQLRRLRAELRVAHKLSLRDLYRSMEQPGKHPLVDAHAALDAAVLAAYGAKPADDALAFLLQLNARCAARERAGQPVTGPGLAPVAKGVGPLVSADALAMPRAPRSRSGH